MCHRSLEKLYKDKMRGRIDSEEELLSYFNQIWQEEYDEGRIKHPNDQYGPDFYRHQGEVMLSRYYRNTFVKDDSEILGVETKDTLTLSNGSQYYVRIDRLAFKDGTYYVCDYKTDRKAKDQATADADRQLAMYALWVWKSFPDADNIKLVWHMLRQEGEQETVVSSRSVEDLDNLENEIVSLIDEIESATEFPIGKDPFCNYCLYQDMCPKFAPKKVLTIEDGIGLVDELVQVQAEKRVLDHRIDSIKADLLELSKTGDYEVISGTDYEVAIEKATTCDSESTDWLQFIKKVMEKNAVDRYLQPKYPTINSELSKNTMDPQLAECIATKSDIRVGRTKKKKPGDDESD